MPKGNIPLLAFNRGEVSPSALARTDVDRIRLSAETMVNWIPKTQGSMKIRPGLEYIGASKSNNEATWIPFVAATDDTALIEFTDSIMRVWVDDEVITRPSVSTSITNGDFSSSSGWTDNSSNGGVVSFSSTLELYPSAKGSFVDVYQQVSVSGGDQNVEHAVRIKVLLGPVTFMIGTGTSSNIDNLVSKTTLQAGEHSLSFTPFGSSFYIRFQLDDKYPRVYSYVTSIAIESAGAMEISTALQLPSKTDTPAYEDDDLPNLRWTQSADVIYLACEGKMQRKIERRGTGRSWSLVEYFPLDGPFRSGPEDNGYVYPDANMGHAITIYHPYSTLFTTADNPSLIRIFQEKTERTEYLQGDSQFASPVRVNGVGSGDRTVTWGTNGSTLSGTLRLQRSFDDEESGFNDTTSRTSTGTGTFVDSNDNSIVWFRVGFGGGDHTSGLTAAYIEYGGGGDYGIGRNRGGTWCVYRPFANSDSSDGQTRNWRLGSWSDRFGWPTAVELYDGRLWWAGRTQFWGSVSDDYESFDEEVDGDSGPINRSIGTGPVDVVEWLLPLQRLLIGTAGSVFAVKSTSFEEPLTPSNSRAQPISTQGCASLPAVKIDNRGVFVQRSGQRVYELVFDINQSDYVAHELTLLHPDLAKGTSITQIAVQRQPDTRVHCVLADGTVAVLTYEPSEEVICWSRVETDGNIEKVAILPGSDEDQVYYHVKRTIDGNTVRYLEKWAKESQCEGGTVTRLADSFKVYSSNGSATLTGLSHVEGETVAVWGDGKYLGTYTVSSGQITVSESVDDACVGLVYTATWKSTKLAYAAGSATALTQKKRLNQLGIIANNMHDDALEYGPDFTTMRSLPRKYKGATVSDDTIRSAYDDLMVAFPGTWDTDARLCLRATAPKPVEVLAAIVGMATHDKA